MASKEIEREIEQWCEASTLERKPTALVATDVRRKQFYKSGQRKPRNRRR